jgi:hypothetical protein
MALALALAVTGQPPAPPWDAIAPGTDPDWEWRTAADDSPEELYALWRAAVQRSVAAVEAALSDWGTGPAGRHSPSATGSPQPPPPHAGRPAR